jgi:hypothetical protein
MGVGVRRAALPGIAVGLIGAILCPRGSDQGNAREAQQKPDLPQPAPPATPMHGFSLHVTAAIMGLGP